MLPESLHPISANVRPKLPFVVSRLTDLAERLGPGAKLPTARQLAQSLGVTGATLSRALEQLERRGVLRCLQGSGIYVEPGMGRKHIGLVFGENIFLAQTSPFGAMVLQQSEQRIREHNERFSYFIDTATSFGVMNGTKVPSHQDLVDAIGDGKLDGVILIARSSMEQEVWLRSHGIPVVSTEARRKRMDPGSSVVMFDYGKLIELGLRRLKEAGCRTVGLIAPLHEHAGMFREALQSLDLSGDDRWVACPENEEDSPPANVHNLLGRRYATNFLSRTSGPAGHELPDGLLITDDMMALGVLTVLTEEGVCPGENLRVCSHANAGSTLLAAWSDRILRVEFDPADIAAAAFEMLEKLMNGMPCPSPIFVDPVYNQV